MSLVTLIQDATDTLGIVRPSSVMGSSDTQVRQLLALAQREGKELARRHNWQALTKERTFTSVAAEEQTGIIPSDFDRFVSDTFYDRTNQRLVNGPMSAMEYANYKSRMAVGVYSVFRMRGNAVFVLPAPPAGLAYSFEYLSNAWAQRADAAEQYSSWRADDDTSLLDEETMTLGVVWRFLKAKGFDYGEAFRTYQGHVSAAIARDNNGPRILSMDPWPEQRTPRAPIVPDGNWPIP